MKTIDAAETHVAVLVRCESNAVDHLRALGCDDLAQATAERANQTRYNDCPAEEREALLATDEAVRADLSKRTPAELDALSALCKERRE
jgi:hypothetical protein